MSAMPTASLSRRALVTRALEKLDDLRQRGYSYTAACPFVVAYLQRHPEYQETPQA